MVDLSDKRVAVFGIGGVGGYVCDTLARAGIKHFLLIDSDRVEKTNLNRQIIATSSSIEKSKTEAMKDRILSISHDAKIETFNIFFDEKTDLNFKNFDFIVDAIDSVNSKLEIIKRAQKENVKIISCMGAGKRLNPRSFLIGNLYSTSVCPLAKKMRKLAGLNNLSDYPVVYSTEEPKANKITDNRESGDKAPLGSISYSVATSGMLAAYYIIDNLI